MKKQWFYRLGPKKYQKKHWFYRLGPKKYQKSIGFIDPATENVNITLVL